MLVSSVLDELVIELGALGAVGLGAGLVDDLVGLRVAVAESVEVGVQLGGAQEVAHEGAGVGGAALAADEELHGVVEVAVGDLGGGQALDLHVDADLTQHGLDDGGGADIGVGGAHGQHQIKAAAIAGLLQQGLGPSGS